MRSARRGGAAHGAWWGRGTAAAAGPRPGDAAERRAPRAGLAAAACRTSAEPSPSACGNGRSPTPAPGRLLPWLPVAFGLGIAIYFTAEREPAWWAAVALTVGLRVPSRFSRAGGRSRSRSRWRWPPSPRASPSPRSRAVQVAHPVLRAPGRQRGDRGLRRGARGARAHRPHRGPRAVARRRAARAEARARARLGAQGHRAAGRQLCDVPRAAQSAARAAAARRLRLRPRSLFPAASARPASCSARSASPSRRRRPACGCATPRPCRACATPSTRASARRVPGDKGAIASALITGKRDAISAPVNDAMYVSSLAHVLSISGYHMAIVAGVVFFVLRALLALVPALREPPPDQEMGGAGGARRGRGLSRAVGRRGRDAARLHHDGDRADRRDGRPRRR